MMNEKTDIYCLQNVLMCPRQVTGIVLCCAFKTISFANSLLCDQYYWTECPLVCKFCPNVASRWDQIKLVSIFEGVQYVCHKLLMMLYHRCDIIQTAGATHGLFVLANLFFSSGDLAFTESLTYFLGLKLLRNDLQMKLQPGLFAQFALLHCLWAAEDNHP